LQQLACVGNTAEIRTLSISQGDRADSVVLSQELYLEVPLAIEHTALTKDHIFCSTASPTEQFPPVKF
jgi:hypothetical protein